jgi:transposase
MGPRFFNEVTMPAERLSMRKIRDVLRMKFEIGLSERAIARSLSLSSGGVNGYLQRARVAGLSWPLPGGLEDAALERLLFPPPPSAAVASTRPVPDWAAVEKELRRRGVTLALLWEEYRAVHSDGFGYSWFCEQHAAFKQRMRPTMRQTHVAGEKAFVDFAGDTIDIVDPATGEVLPMKLFVAVMGASNYLFAQARASEKIADWIGAHVDLFAFLGGVPKFVVCDNLKAAVTNPDRYEPGLNRSYLELADHYGAAILPARPRKPRDKAKVEQSVLLAERWILAKLRDRRFFGAADLNAAIADLTRDINARLMKGFNASRAELFAAIDKPALKELPHEPYAFAVWKRCRVAPDYHIEIDGHWYSTPFRLIKELVDARVADKTVEIFHKGQRVASHPRAPNRRGHTTIPEHMPSSHRRHGAIGARTRSVSDRYDAGAIDCLRREDRTVGRRVLRGGHGGQAASRTGLSNLPGGSEPHPRLRQDAARRRLPARRVHQGALGRLHSLHSPERPGSRLPR